MPSSLEPQALPESDSGNVQISAEAAESATPSSSGHSSSPTSPQQVPVADASQHSVEGSATAPPMEPVSEPAMAQEEEAQEEEAQEEEAQEEEKTPEVAPEPKPNAFAALGLHPSLVEGLSNVGYTEPTPIQAQTIPSLLRGADLVGLAQTGTGKTAAFSLPLLQQLDLSKKVVQGLVLCPTRELALQVSEAFRNYGRQLGGVRVVTVYGGEPIEKQVQLLRQGAHVVVGTPGRIMDCLRRGILSLSAVRHVVLDECDEMLRMGFIEDVEWILGLVPNKRQMALFSATLPPAISRVAQSYLHDPVSVSIEQQTRTVDRIEQRVVVAKSSDKINVLSRILEAEVTDAVLVFARTRANCTVLVDELRQRGLSAAALNGDMSQALREQVVRQLKARRVRLVVATDVAARGLDVDGISHVINFDPPSEAEVYVHRIGRTGRAGKTGISVLMLTPRERHQRQQIERFTGHRMIAMEVPSNAQIVKGRQERLKQELLETLSKVDLKPYRKVVEELLESMGEHADAVAIASAFARMASSATPLVVSDPEPKKAPAQPFERRDSRGGRNDRPQRERRPRGQRPEGPMVRLFIPIGSAFGVGPGDLVGAITAEAGIPGDSIGFIKVHDKVSFVEVTAEHADAVLENMGPLNIRGRTAPVIRARDDAGHQRAEGGIGAPGGHGQRGGRPGGGGGQGYRGTPRSDGGRPSHRSPSHRPPSHRPPNRPRHGDSAPRDSHDSAPREAQWRGDDTRSSSGGNYDTRPSFGKKPFEKRTFDKKPFEKKPYDKKKPWKSSDSSDEPRPKKKHRKGPPKPKPWLENKDSGSAPPASDG